MIKTLISASTSLRLILSLLCLYNSAYVNASEKLVFTSVEDAYIQRISESVLKEAYGRLNISFETSWQPAKRALKIVGSGLSDGEISRVAAIGKIYPELIRVSVPVNHLEGMVYSKNKDLIINGWESLEPYKIGIGRGIRFAEMGTNGMNVLKVNGFTSLFQMLGKNRVDVIVAPKIVGLYQIASFGTEDVVANEPPVIKLNQYHYLNKKHKKLALRLEKVLKEMQEEGKIDAIRAAYVNELEQGQIREFIK